MAATAASEVSEGPVLNFINKRLRALKKKQNRISQMEESLAKGKDLNKEQEEVLRSKPTLLVQIEELEKLRQPLAAAVAEEIDLAVQRRHVAGDKTLQAENDGESDAVAARPSEPSDDSGIQNGAVEELLNLLYFGTLFDVKSQSDFTRIVLTRTHERECCLTYDTITDDDTEMLGAKDLDLISTLGELLISRPADSSLSHKNALERCVEHAKLWIAKSDQPIEPNSNVTYASLRERLSKIMGSVYFTTTPEMKAPVDVAVAAGNYAPFQVPVSVPVQVEGFQQKDEDRENFQGQETGDNQSNTEDLQKDELETEHPSEVVSAQPETEADQNQRDLESEQQHGTRRPYQNQRGARGGGGRRGYSNGRGGRGSGRGFYQNGGRNQFYDQPGGYYPRNRGRGSRGGGSSYNNHGSAAQDGYSANVGVAS